MQLLSRTSVLDSRAAMASETFGQHPLSLKVMRVSRPSLASNWQPFFSSSPSFSQHATMSPLSLQGAEPLQGHPKTLRDMTHSGQMLQLPAAFGALQLGETFACVLSVNNEINVPIDAVQAKIEMQTISSKVALTDIEASSGNGTRTLLAGDSVETVVSHEVKELGQHVLACSVTYRTPPGMRPATNSGENSDDPFMQTFRKFYKFHVCPLNNESYYSIRLTDASRSQIRCLSRPKYIHPGAQRH